MPEYDISNLVTATKTNTVGKMHCGYGIRWTTAERIWQHVCCKDAPRSQLGSKSVPDLCCVFRCSKMYLPHESNLVASSMYFHNSRCFQEHLRMPLQSLKALFLASGRHWSISKYLGAWLRSTNVTERYGCGFQIDLHSAEVMFNMWMISFISNYAEAVDFQQCILIPFVTISQVWVVCCWSKLHSWQWCPSTVTEWLNLQLVI